MRERLTKNDKKVLKYQCRAGIVVSMMVLVFCSFGMLYGYFEYRNHTKYADFYLSLSILLVLALSLRVRYIMMGKYLKDIRNGEKVLEIKKIQSKEFKTDHEAGSGTVAPRQEMNAFDSYNLIIDNYRCKVDKVLYDQCEEGGEVVFYIAPISDFRIDIKSRN